MKSRSICFSIVFGIFLTILNTTSVKSQILISLLLGDKLNSGELEFGLDGGLNFSDMSQSEGNWARNLNLGFFFYIRTSEKSWIHTGVLVKSTFGVDNLYTYPSGDAEVDTLMTYDGKINRRLEYFNVPITYCHYIRRPFFIEGGFMLALRKKAFDEFVTKSAVGDDISIKRNIKDQVKPLDAGLMAGLGYKFQKGLGISVGSRYYYGLVNAHTDVYGVKHKNTNLYVYITVPIGKGMAEKKRQEKESEGQ